MKKVFIAFAISLLAATSYAEKHASKKPSAQKGRSGFNKKMDNGDQIKALEKEQARDFDLNTRMWLQGLRIKIYGFDPNRKPGQKGGC